MRKAIRQQQQQTPPSSSLGGRFGTSAVKAGLSFGPAQIVAAITFHLLDEGLATRVFGDSALAAVRRLTAAGPVVEISRSLWQEMSNPERLAWLLATSETSYHVGRDGVARFAVR